jgi:hypothetical protein
MATLNFTTTFDLSVTPNEITFIDTSDYAGQGIPLANVNGSFQIISPSGSQIYNNGSYTDANCDIDVATSTSSQQTINFTPEQGNYLITYTVYDNNLLTYSTKTITVNNSYVQPTITIAQTANCIGQVWTQEDTTDYVVNGVTPTKSIVNTLYYPAGSAGFGAPYSNAASILSTTTFYNGTQTSEITATLSYAFSGLTVTDVITATKEMKVDCSYYCSILCCILSYERLKESYRGNNTVKFKEANEKFHEIMDYVSLIRLSIECNDGASTDIGFYLNIIKSLSNCNSDCDCSGDDFSRVTGWGSVIGADGTDGNDGADGSDGTDGTNGTTLLNNNIVVDSAHSGVAASLKSYTLAAGQLATNGDALEIVTSYSIVDTSSSVKFIGLEMGGNTLIPNMFGTLVWIGSPSVVVTMRTTITRRSATTVAVVLEWRTANSFGADVTAGTFYEPTVTVNDMGAATNVIDIQGTTTAPATILCNQLMIKYLNI